GCIVLYGGAARVERVVVNGNLPDTARPRHGKLSPRTSFTEQGSGERGASLNSRKPRGKNRRNMLDCPGQNQWPAAEDDQDDGLAGCRNGFQQLFLLAGKPEMCAGGCFAGHLWAVFT